MYIPIIFSCVSKSDMEFGDQHDNDIISMDMQEYWSNDQWSQIPDCSFPADPIVSEPDYSAVQTCRSINEFDELTPMFAAPADQYNQHHPSSDMSLDDDVLLLPLGDIDLEAFSTDYSTPLPHCDNAINEKEPYNMTIIRPAAAEINQNADHDHNIITCRPNGYEITKCGHDEQRVLQCGRRAYGSGRTRLDDIGFDEIRKFFYMPIKKAAKEMNVGLTVLKTRCRELGIPRWPHRKMKSLNSLILNFQEMGKGQSEQMIQKELAMLETHRTLMEANPEMQLTERTKKLRQACFKESYKRRGAANMHLQHYFGHHLASGRRSSNHFFFS